MKIDKEFINAILEENNHPFLYSNDVYLPAHIIIENFKASNYVELRLLREFYVEKLTTSYMCTMYRLTEEELSDIVTQRSEMIMNAIRNAISVYPKREWEIITSSEAAIACRNAGVGCIYIDPEWSIKDLNLGARVHNMLLSNRLVSVNKLYALNKSADLCRELSGCTKKHKQEINDALSKFCEDLRKEVSEYVLESIDG